jgi:DNA transformation protein
VATRGAFKRMAVREEFRDFVLDQLRGVPRLRALRMFGGVGLYSGEVFFAILAGDELFLKVDDTTRARYEAVGSQPFRPFADRPMTMAYWRVPLEVLEDGTELVTWAREAVRVAAAAPAKPRKTKPKGKRSAAKPRRSK